MKKSKRIIIPPKVLAAESAAITQFLFDRAVPVEGLKLPLQKFYDVYETWRRENKMGLSAVNIDGFGRLFPKAYPRRTAYWPPIKHSLKCVYGLDLKA